ncbi:dipeptidase [Mageeibacillus indolicus]|uniref:Dipeptidase n=1 Tax=Mageeibacillus indolicus TaxID=884684 RepID=A0A2J8B4Y4_9FIRM|nr:C69 family dipeptidase [Mageeibacillus indolicus]PNH19816.1 dipeptidase [Mageeibacillus indolicus]
MPCTTLLVGKKATYDGSTMVARNEDSPSGQFTPKKFVVVQPDQQPRHYKSILSHVEIELPDNPMRYTAMPNGFTYEGIWAACGVNSANVSMTATETITANERLLGADPLVEYRPAKGKPGDPDYQPEVCGGIGEEDIVTICLPYIHSAREGVLRLGELLTKYGTYELNGIAFQDVNEIWWLETIGGHHWIAKRVPDEAYVVMPNQLGIDEFDFKDALGKKVNHLCSDDLYEFVQKYHLDLSKNGKFNPRHAFGTASDADHTYNTPRAWVIQRYFNRNSAVWDTDAADLRPDSDNIPWARVPEKKITPEDVKYTLSGHFQGTPFDPYAHYGESNRRGSLRPIGINRNNFLGLVQLRPDMPDELCAVEWIAYGSNVFNAMVPFYITVNRTPDYLARTTTAVTTESFYWANRLIGALADAHFAQCSSHIERYQISVGVKAHTLLNTTEAGFAAAIDAGKTAEEICESANEAMANMAKDLTDDCLNKVLHTASCGMLNGFSRSDA